MTQYNPEYFEELLDFKELDYLKEATSLEDLQLRSTLVGFSDSLIRIMYIEHLDEFFCYTPLKGWSRYRVDE